MGEIRTRLRETGWASIAGALQSLIPLGSFLILARLAKAEELGRYSLAVAIVVPVFLAARMQLRQAAVADPEGASSFGAYRRLRFASATVALASVAAFAQVMPWESRWVLCAVALGRWAEEIGDIQYAPAQRAGRWPRITASQLLRLIGVVTLLPIGWSFGELSVALAVAATWQMAITVGFDAPLARRLEPDASDGIGAGELLRLNWSLGATAAVVSLISYVPRYALAWSNGESAVGDYAALAQAALFGNLVVQGAGQASLARLGCAYARDREGFRRLVAHLLWFSASVGIAALATAALWGDLLLGAVFHPRFAEFQWELTVMMITSLFVYVTSVFGYALTAAGAKTVQLAIFGAALVAGLAATFPLCAEYGIAGAIGGTACSWATAAILAGLLLRRIVAEGRHAAGGAAHSRAV